MDSLQIDLDNLDIDSLGNAVNTPSSCPSSPESVVSQMDWSVEKVGRSELMRQDSFTNAPSVKRYQFVPKTQKPNWKEIKKVKLFKLMENDDYSVNAGIDLIFHLIQIRGDLVKKSDLLNLFNICQILLEMRDQDAKYEKIFKSKIATKVKEKIDMEQERNLKKKQRIEILKSENEDFQTDNFILESKVKALEAEIKQMRENDEKKTEEDKKEAEDSQSNDVSDPKEVESLRKQVTELQQTISDQKVRLSTVQTTFASQVKELIHLLQCQKAESIKQNEIMKEQQELLSRKREEIENLRSSTKRVSTDLLNRIHSNIHK